MFNALSEHLAPETFSLFLSLSLPPQLFFFLLVSSSSLVARFLSCLQLLPSTCTRFQDSSYDYQEIRDYRLIILGAVKRTNYRIELRFRLQLCVSYIETRDAIRRSCRESKNKRELSRIKAEASLLVRAKKFNLFPSTSIEPTDRHF